MPSWAWFAQSGSPRYAGNARTPAKTVALCPRAQRGMVSNLGLERCSLLRCLVARQRRRRPCAFCDAYGVTLDNYGARPGRTDDHRPRLARGCRGRCAWEMLIAVDDDWRWGNRLNPSSPPSPTRSKLWGGALAWRKSRRRQGLARRLPKFEIGECERTRRRPRALAFKSQRPHWRTAPRARPSER